MTIIKIGYIRVSTTDQNTARQEVLMRELGVEKVFIDRMSGKNMDRPQLKEMLSFVRQGDTVVVESISRFARNTRDLLKLVEQLTKKGVEFVSKKEAIDTTTPTGKFMLTIFGAVAELEREYILQRQKRGHCHRERKWRVQGAQAWPWRYSWSGRTGNNIWNHRQASPPSGGEALLIHVFNCSQHFVKTNETVTPNASDLPKLSTPLAFTLHLYYYCSNRRWSIHP